MISLTNVDESLDGQWTCQNSGKMVKTIKFNVNGKQVLYEARVKRSNQGAQSAQIIHFESAWFRTFILWKSFWRWHYEYSTISVYFLLVVWDERLCSPFQNWTFKYLKRNEKRGDILSWLDANCFCRFILCRNVLVCVLLYLCAFVCVSVHVIE